jgi:hypothetical protein
MTDKDGGSDMNSTPISKLPPPSLASGKMTETAPLPQGVNYQEILRSVDLARNNPSQLSAQQDPRPYEEEPSTMRMRARAQAQAQAQAQARARERARQQLVKKQQRGSVGDDPTPAAKTTPAKFDFKFLRPGLIVAVIVFVVLLKIAPLVANKLPFSIDSVTGKFTTAGLLIVSFLAGGTFLFADEMIKKYT